MPLRCFMLYCITKAGNQRNIEDTIRLLLDLTTHKIWDVNRNIGVVVYIVFFLGVLVLVAKLFFLSPADHLFYGLVGNIVVFLLHLYASFQGIRDVIEPDVPIQVSTETASPEDIKKYTTSSSWKSYCEENNIIITKSPKSDGHGTITGNVNSNINNNGADDDDDDEHECPICYGGFTEDDNVRILRCGHVYHLSCVDQWLGSKSICPTCTAHVSPYNKSSNTKAPTPAQEEQVEQEEQEQEQEIAAEVQAESEESQIPMQEAPTPMQEQTQSQSQSQPQSQETVRDNTENKTSEVEQSDLNGIRQRRNLHFDKQRRDPSLPHSDINTTSTPLHGGRHPNISVDVSYNAANISNIEVLHTDSTQITDIIPSDIE